MKKILMGSLVIAAAIMASSCREEQKPAPHQTKVIAHRGYWNTEGSAQNSLEALRKAAAIGCYGSEFDVHLTSDGVLVINHDHEIEGVSLEHNPYSAFEDHTLANGETIPTLRQYLEEGSKYPEMKLVLEVKSASSPERETEVVEAILAMVDEMDLASQMEYISFSYHVCREIIARDAGAKVAYLNGDKTPEQLKADGIPGLDYNIGKARGNAELFDQARENGIYTNIWTVNSEEDMREIITYGVDFITTDHPELALAVVGDMENPTPAL